jgi:hypothetical protein
MTECPVQTELLMPLGAYYKAWVLMATGHGFELPRNPQRHAGERKYQPESRQLPMPRIIEQCSTAVHWPPFDHAERQQHHEKSEGNRQRTGDPQVAAIVARWN